MPGARSRAEIILEVRRAPLAASPAIALWPHPPALSDDAWNYLALFVAVIIALILEPLPPGAVGLLGMTLGMVLGYVAPPNRLMPSSGGLSGFSDGTVWLIFGSLVFATGYEKTGLGRRIALTLVRLMGRSTLGLGYAVMLADLLIAPFTPSNTGHMPGSSFRSFAAFPRSTARRAGPHRRVGSARGCSVPFSG